MSNVDNRQVTRDSLFLLAQLKVDGQDAVHRVKVRNLSAGGMMAEGDVKVVRGSLVSVELRNLGWIDGAVAWKQDDRFGIAFVDHIDTADVRAPAASQVPTPDIQAGGRPASGDAAPSRLRKA